MMGRTNGQLSETIWPVNTCLCFRTIGALSGDEADQRGQAGQMTLTDDMRLFALPFEELRVKPIWLTKVSLRYSDDKSSPLR